MAKRVIKLQSHKEQKERGDTLEQYAVFQKYEVDTSRVMAPSMQKRLAACLGHRFISIFIVFSFCRNNLTSTWTAL